jgi:polyhydroxybutyrate depolymerase
MRLVTSAEARAAALIGALFLGACSGSGGSSDGSGGSPGSGGTSSGSGGTSSGAGGTNAGTGGVIGTGGLNTGTGGATASGGRVGTGGRGGAGGAKSTGGTIGSGGASSATGGSAGGAAGAVPSAGCGQATTLKSGTATIDVSGTSRTYILQIPSNYDPSKPYKLIFGFHWLGGSASDVASGTIIGGAYYGLSSRSAGSAILVAPDGLPDPSQNNSKGWPNTNGQDVAFVKAMLQQFESNLCIDQSRIFSTGFSYGGIFSLTLGCEMSDVFRAVAPESGEFFGSCRTKGGPVAVWQAQGDSDTTVPPANAQAANNYFATTNHCSTQTTAVSPSPCVTYQGCDSGYPVTWCEFSGGHMPWSQAPDPVWAFFNQF